MTMVLPTTNDGGHMKTYPGTDLLVRICYSADCQKPITELTDLWVDSDSNCCVCTECRDKARADYESDIEWALSIVSAISLVFETGSESMINELEEG